ncbi:MAG TPA: PEP/pyruvate-binding domain-containing protein [Candidatus Dormibacteraeota bacterium]|nr:PEP/pyruvate-binding domain-containing protein [Candidatus Dormibacteraeota bacterium]
MERGQRNLVAWLGEADAGPELLGGKGASLDRLGKLGFRIPRGFCLTTDAFRAQAASGSGPSDIATAPLDGSVRAELERALGRLVTALGNTDGSVPGFAPRLAVRSSAVGEDGSAASYAGLHETELDVAPEGVADSVRRCWASLWSAPAIAYRTRRGLADDAAEMAVVVQSLVPADASAVAFTRHPVTGRDDQMVVTAVRGLGDAMVAGTVTPDTYVIDKASGAVLVFEPGEGLETPALSPAALDELVRLCLDVEARYGRAVDIEASMAATTWYLLQARPITTGAPS